ncbi:MAG: Wzz/FepE/Etk N-terminal domain-containing protein, partial [bacterium]|nr:Wzz/FepE/Etk N-terminal domain-containing protein [bacterium]
MANTFTYDLVSFLRVLYQRKGLIFKGTFVVTVVVMIASVLWPQTWRADARVLVTTPKYKTTLRLIPEPFDVLTYRGIMTSDNIYKELLDTLKWFKTAIDTLLEHENFNRMRDNLPGKADTLSPLQLIENTNLPYLTQLLVPEAER